jgi:hypothetical protein
VVVDVALVVALIITFIGAAGDINKIPLGLLIASDHAVFIGVMTNAILALQLLSAERAGTLNAGLSQIVFWGVNVGLVGFLFGLILNAAILKEIFTPIMGLSLLVAIGAFSLQLWSEREPMATQA